MTTFYPRCDKCGGNIIKDGNDRKCLQCGREWKSNYEKTAFYDFHMDEILADFKELSWEKTIAKWHISTGTFSGLIKRWSQGKPFTKSAPPPANHPGGFPSLPPWRDDWDPEVQKAWLAIYDLVIKYSLKEVKP